MSKPIEGQVTAITGDIVKVMTEDGPYAGKLIVDSLGRVRVDPITAPVQPTRDTGS